MDNITDEWKDEFREFWYQAPVKPIQEEVDLICNWLNGRVVAPLQKQLREKEDLLASCIKAGERAYLLLEKLEKIKPIK